MTPARINRPPTAAPIPMPAFAPVDRDDAFMDVAAEVDEDVEADVTDAVEAGDADNSVEEADVAALVVLGIDVSDACHLISIPYALRFARPVAVESDAEAVNIYVLVVDP